GKRVSRGGKGARDKKKWEEAATKPRGVMCGKWEKNDINRTAGMRRRGPVGPPAEMKRSKPAMTNRKLTVVAPMKASTWLLVSAEMAAASARNAPAISHEPI